MDYTKLSTQDKKLFTMVLEKKRELEKSKEDYAKLLNSILPLVKESGTLTKGEDKISYLAPNERVALDTKRLEEEMPEVFNEYKKVISTKESARVTLH